MSTFAFLAFLLISIEKMKNFTESGVTETWFDPVWTTRQKIIDGENAWSKDIFKSLRYRDGKKVGATEVMSKWMTAVLSSNPGCGASLFTCQHSYFRLPNDYCTSFKESCPLLF